MNALKEKQNSAEESNLVRHAREELRRAGMFDADADYGPGYAEHIVDIVRVVSEGGHSGGSMFGILAILPKLLAFEVLTPITSDPDTWTHIAEEIGGKNFWQSKRQPDCFSRDGGKTWYFLSDPDTINSD